MKSLAACSAMVLVVVGFETSTEAQTELNHAAQALTSPNASVRTEAVVQLGELGLPAAIQPLAQTVRSDPLPSVRQWALHALAQIGTPEAVEVIRTAVEHDADPRVREFAAQRVAELEAARLPEPVAAQEDPQEEVDELSRISTNTTVVVNTPVVQQQTTIPTTVAVTPRVSPSVSTTLSLRAERARPRAGRGLIAIGWSIFGSAYAASFSALVEDDSGISTIPVIGPFSMGVLALVDPWHEQEVFLGLVSIITSLIQATGFSLGIAGLVRRRRARRMGVLDAQRRPCRVSVIPSGLGVGGVF